MKNENEAKEKAIKPEESSGFLLQLIWAKLRSWLEEICPHGELDDYCQVMANDTPLGIVKVRIFTHDYRYSIFIKQLVGENLCLSCSATRRKSLAGVTDYTYADLVDGKFSRVTWELIKASILRFELVKLTVRARGEQWQKMNSHYEMDGRQIYAEWLQRGDEIKDNRIYELTSIQKGIVKAEEKKR
ncbi:MAG: hypothetical protein KAV87_06225 [Desulfobacteraceae bacterium]|nr:hypothetical protein [Desulfobacteraceae bacterium]